MSVLMSLRNIEKRYRAGEHDFYALKGVDLDIDEGEMVVILGPSGAGKSTLLNLIGGMDSPTGGELLFEGEDIALYNDDELTRFRALSVGVVFQFYNLIPTLTAYENVALMRDVKDDCEDPMRCLEMVGLSDHAHQFPAQMSGGEQQRVSIARAIAKKPKLLLCDEPTGALDTDTGREVLRLLLRVCREEGRTVVMVTHNASFARIADTVIRVKNGKVVSQVKNENPESADVINY
ncbi:MAG: ABC transporter ATP-binding protein [Lachnospiraceae bacterium]|nr:ABC transporter ATP-binding protein [Lachnospiraceae bacterium]MBR4175620.1 ABC transporter ATP-binding protein [Lachnospiraceae bacterium]